jgi:Tfp pilus assembly protein PilN
VSLRARLLLSLAVMLAVALLVAGVLLVGLVRASLVDRVDAELRALDRRGEHPASVPVRLRR